MTMTINYKQIKMNEIQHCHTLPPSLKWRPVIKHLTCIINALDNSIYCIRVHLSKGDRTKQILQNIAFIGEWHTIVPTLLPSWFFLNSAWFSYCRLRLLTVGKDGLCRSQKVVQEGKSSSVPVLSCVPQGSVLGPVLFLIYINDLPEYVSNSIVRLFADDTLLYWTIHNSSDCDKLQEDLNNLERWDSDWQMSFHLEKCEVIHITTKKTPIWHRYSLHGHILSSVPHMEYISVKTLSGIHTLTPPLQRQIWL